ncbi:MAG: hypothetical protein ACM3PP_06420 [Candidatus Saccharibacteria bacterium]
MRKPNKSISSLVILAFVLTFCLAISGSALAVKPAAIKWTGLWNTTYGQLKITQSGNKIVGTYTYKQGKLTGIAKGNQITGTWIEIGQSGSFVMVMAPNGQAFTAKWNYKGSNIWYTDWKGVRKGKITITPRKPATPPTPPVNTGIPSTGSTNTGTPPATTDNGQASQPSTSGPWAGAWNCIWGEAKFIMNLTGSGNQVTGTYGWRNGRITNATIDGNVLKGTWTETTATQTEESGTFEFTLSADGKSFTGKWRYGTSGDWETVTWNATR